MSARNVSHGTSRSIASSGSPFADKASKRLSASKNPSCPIVASANQNLTHQIRTGRENQLFFEVPMSKTSEGNKRPTEQRLMPVSCSPDRYPPYAEHQMRSEERRVGNEDRT